MELKLKQVVHFQGILIPMSLNTVVRVQMHYLARMEMSIFHNLKKKKLSLLPNFLKLYLKFHNIYKGGICTTCFNEIHVGQILNFFLFSQGSDFCCGTIFAAATFFIPFEVFTAVKCFATKKLYSLCSSETFYLCQSVASSLNTFSKN